MGFLFFDVERPKLNDVSFQKCHFFNNSADYGGGILLYYSTSSDYANLENNVKFDSCTWKENNAKFGSAANIATHTWDTLNRGYLPSPVFKDSTFEHNRATRGEMLLGKSSAIGKGAFMAVGIDIQFEGATSFKRNNGTALYLTSSNAEFATKSNVSFIGKEWRSYSHFWTRIIVINDNSSFVFKDNYATETGGAIYQVSYNKNDYVASRSCFIHYAGSTGCPENRDIYFTFRGNGANNGSN